MLEWLLSKEKETTTLVRMWKKRESIGRNARWCNQLRKQDEDSPES